MNKADSIKKLEWLSDFFGLKCGEVIPPLEPKLIQENDYDFLQGKCSENDKNSKEWFEKNNFYFEDSRVTFTKEIEKKNLHNTDIAIKKASLKEVDQIASIARNTMAEHSRFFNLVGIDKTKDFYATWVKNAVSSDFDHICFFASIENQITGFITLRFVENKKTIIGLLGVEKKYWGRGIARALIQHTENYLSREKFTKLEVTTEGKNGRAIEFYKRYGFTLKYIELWYYKILNNKSSILT